MSTPRLLALALAAGVGLALAGSDAGNPAADPAAMRQLVEAVSLDLVSEAAVDACDDLGASGATRLREAWVAWRARHQMAPMTAPAAAAVTNSRATRSRSRTTTATRSGC